MMAENVNNRDWLGYTEQIRGIHAINTYFQQSTNGEFNSFLSRGLFVVLFKKLPHGIRVSTRSISFPRGKRTRRVCLIQCRNTCIRIKPHDQC
ncbi:hypothetical protein Hanom_Chr17g01575161 [Helianthus anomalus]